MSLKPNKKGTIAFRNAAENGEFEKCQKIMNQMIKNNVQDKNPKSKYWETVLHGAALSGFHRICKLIMDNVEINVQFLKVSEFQKGLCASYLPFWKGPKKPRIF